MSTGGQEPGGFPPPPQAPATGLAAFEPLGPAEVRMLADLQSGRFDRLGDGLRPLEADPERTVRAALIRFILLGGEAGCRPHEKGLRVNGAYISGVLDLEGCRIPRDIGLKDCAFESSIVLRSAVIDNLFLDGSAFTALRADRVEARGALCLNGARIADAVELREARIAGSIEGNDAAIHGGEIAFDATGADVRGGILMRGAAIRGRVRLVGGRIGADLDCVGAKITHGDALALDGDNMTVRGDIALRESRVSGAIQLCGVDVGGDVDCSGTYLAMPGGVALNLNRSTVGGVFFLRRGADVAGAVDLRQTRIGAIEDDRPSWPQPGELLLNRCRYGAFIGGPVDAASRLDWLRLQAPERWGEDFWPQPYEQLATVFLEMGHEEEAQAVLIAKERLQRRARRERERNPLLRGTLALIDGILGATLLYGRKPLLAFVWLFAFWAAGVFVFDAAERAGAFKPGLPFILRSPEWLACGLPTGASLRVPSLDRDLPGQAEPGETQLACYRRQPEGVSFPRFQALMYSLDVLLPVLQLNQTSYWRPNPAVPLGSAALNYYYVQTIVGWVLSLLAIAGFSGLVKSR